LNIDVQCNRKRYKVDARKLATLARFICRHLGLPRHDLGVALVESDEIKRLNKQFRRKNKATDVLSFPQIEWDKPRRVGAAPVKRHRGAPPESLGDVVISVAEAKANAVEIGQPLDREIAFLLVHGILHLCGHDHMRTTDERRMLTEQRKLMRLMGERARGPLWQNSVQERRA
jgi:probable rRNA maturation factor